MIFTFNVSYAFYYVYVLPNLHPIGGFRNEYRHRKDNAFRLKNILFG